MSAHLNEPGHECDDVTFWRQAESKMLALLEEARSNGWSEKSAEESLQGIRESLQCALEDEINERLKSNPLARLSLAAWRVLERQAARRVEEAKAEGDATSAAQFAETLGMVRQELPRIELEEVEFLLKGVSI